MHIREVQNAVRKAGSITDEQIAMIIAARQLGNAVRGDGSNIEKTKFTAAALQQKSGALLQDPAFKEFIASYRNFIPRLPDESPTRAARRYSRKNGCFHGSEPNHNI